MAAIVDRHNAGINDGSGYQLVEGSVKSIGIVPGWADPYSKDKVKKTRIRIWNPSGNVTVAKTAAGVLRWIPAGSSTPTSASLGPLLNGTEFVVEYEGQSQKVVIQGDPYWSFYAIIQGKTGASGYETVYFSTELLRSDGSVYAASQRSVNLLLINSAGAGLPPDGPAENVTAEPSGSTKIMLGWTTSDRTTETRIEFKLPTDPDWTLVDTVSGGGDMQYEKTGLTELTTYQFRFRCENTYGESAYSSTVSAKTYATPTLPDAPTITSVTAPNYSTIVIQFTPSAERSAGDGRLFPNIYTLYYYPTSTPASIEELDVDNTGTNFVVTGLTAETSYTVYMTASNDAGESAATATQAVTTPVNTLLPSVPTNFTVTTSDYITQTITWSIAVNNVLGFGLYYSTDGGTTYTPVNTTSPLSADTRSYVATNLTAATTYTWLIFSYNFVDGVQTYSANVTDSEDTETPPDQPGNPTITAQAIGNSSIQISFTPSVTGETLGYKLYRSVTAGVDTSDTELPDIDAGQTVYVDTGLESNATYYYAAYAVGWAGNVGPSSEVSATTRYQSGEISQSSGFTLHEDSRNRIKEVGGRTIITSDRDRWIVRDNTTGSWFKGGIRPIKDSVTLAKAAGGVLENGTYKVYLVLCRGEKTRSIPSEPSATVTISDSSRTLRVTPPLNDAATEVECRDIGYDVFGNEITGADSWEIYLAEENQDQAYRVVRLPIAKDDWETASNYYEIDDALTKQDIFGGTRRPMELLGESSLPPAAFEVEVKDNRVIATGEIDFEPTQEETDDGATLVISGGAKLFELTDWDATDACINHRLYINGVDTGWEVWDYEIDGTSGDVDTCYIRHSDPAVNAAGFEGAGGSFTDFALKGNPNRVYCSAWFSGEALAQPTFSPETFPPLTIYENEFVIEDNNSPKGLIMSGEALLVAKDDKWIGATGGDEPDYPEFKTWVLSQGSGLNAINSMARDANDVVYYLGDTGPFRITPAGVEKINIKFGNARLFTDVFDMSSVPNAKGAWFSREDWYICVGLNRVGKSGYRDGFVLDVKNGALMPFTLAGEITHIKEYKSVGGEFQLMLGTVFNRIGYLFRKGLYVDQYVYNDAYGYWDYTVIKTELVTGVVDTEFSISPRWVQPRIKMPKAGDVPFQFLFQYDGKDRCSDPNTFFPDDTIAFTPQDLGHHISLAGGWYDQIQFRVLAQTDGRYKDSWFEIKELPVRAVIRHG